MQRFKFKSWLQHSEPPELELEKQRAGHHARPGVMRKTAFVNHFSRLRASVNEATKGGKP